MITTNHFYQLKICQLQNVNGDFTCQFSEIGDQMFTLKMVALIIRLEVKYLLLLLINVVLH